MRVGDDAVGRHGKARAMAETRHLIVDHRDGDDPHDPARRRGDIVGARRGGQKPDDGQGERKDEAAEHRRPPYPATLGNGNRVRLGIW